MLQNKIYQNFIKEIIKTFLVILFGLTAIAWTVRAVNFLDLIVDDGFAIMTYFQYSILNIFGILTKFIPLSFLLSLIIFIIKQIQENEFIILWTSGVKKLKIVNLFFIISVFVLIFYFILSTIITPLALNKSRTLLSKDGYNSFLPTIRIAQFSDSFKGFTFLVEDKFKNQIKNVFMHDSSNILKGLSTKTQDTQSTTIIAKEGIVKEKKMLLFNGQIISTEKNSKKENIIKFEQLNIDLNNLETNTITQPKLQETSTLDLLKCVFIDQNENEKILNCKKDSKDEIITVLNRRFILPFYIPVVALMCSFLLIKVKRRKNYFLNKYTIFIFSFIILLYSELIIRYTGISKVIGLLFILSPVFFIPLIYILLIYLLKREAY